MYEVSLEGLILHILSPLISEAVYEVPQDCRLTPSVKSQSSIHYYMSLCAMPVRLTAQWVPQTWEVHLEACARQCRLANT